MWGGETGSPFFVQYKMRRRTVTGAPFALRVQLKAGAFLKAFSMLLAHISIRSFLWEICLSILVEICSNSSEVSFTLLHSFPLLQLIFGYSSFSELLSFPPFATRMRALRMRSKNKKNASFRLNCKQRLMFHHGTISLRLLSFS